MLEIQYTFLDKDLQKLAKIDPVLRKEINGAIEDSAFLVETTAKKRIQRGAKTGHIYKRGKRGRIKHQASAPGESPATDTGTLARSIRTTRNRAEMYAETGSNLVYAPMLEQGTRHILPRPWLEPSLRENLPKIEKLIDAALKRAFK